MSDPRLRNFTIGMAVFVLALYSCSCGFFFALFVSSVHPAFYPELYPGLCPETPGQGPPPTSTAGLPEFTPTPTWTSTSTSMPPTPAPSETPSPTPTEPPDEGPTPMPPYPEPSGEGPAPTPMLYPGPSSDVPETCNCTGPDLDCEDFTTFSAAQACFDYCLSLGYDDPYDLDGEEKDGTVCEYLP